MSYLKIDLLKTITLCGFVLCFFACANVPVQDEDPLVQEKRIPVSLSASIHVSLTRVDNSAFEAGDAIGLYMTESSSSLEELPYANNVRFTCSASGSFSSEEILFYPKEEEGEEGKTYDLLAYYPYQDENGITEDGGTIKVAVQTDQSSQSAFSASDFMAATSLDRPVSKEPVPLFFRHKLSRLNIRILPGEGYTADGLLRENPIVRIVGTPTKALYDFSSDKLSGYNSVEDIIPNGKWEVKDGLLVGKRVVIIPQATSSRVSIEVKIGDMYFSGQFDASSLGNSSHDVTLTISSDTQEQPAVLYPDIEEWKAGENITNSLKAIAPYDVPISKLDFTKALIYQLKTGNLVVGEVCREYLFVENIIKARAVVVYPVKDGKTDLTDGLVVVVEGSETKNVHGGKVSWDNNGHLTYAAGTLAPVSAVYVTSENKIEISRTGTVLALTYSPYLLTDTRRSETHTYPIVKIGRQYWLGENLQTSKYTDGTDIIAGDFQDSSAGFYKKSGSSFFYNSKAVSIGLPPSGWKIADDTAWKTLKAYIGGNAAVLKSSESEWKNPPSDIGLTGFNAIASGLYNQKTYIDNYAAFWSVSDSSPKEAKGSVILETTNEITTEGGNGELLGLSVRLIRQ